MNIYVGNISWGLNDQDLENLFAEHGTVTSAKIITDRMTIRSRGFGFVEMSDGAEKAILQNKSLLPSGVLDIKGNFSRGDILSILNEKNIKIGIGVIAYDHSEAKKIIGKKSKEIKFLLGYEGRDEIIHKDDLVKIKL